MWCKMKFRAYNFVTDSIPKFVHKTNERKNYMLPKDSKILKATWDVCVGMRQTKTNTDKMEKCSVGVILVVISGVNLSSFHPLTTARHRI